MHFFRSKNSFFILGVLLLGGLGLATRPWWDILAPWLAGPPEKAGEQADDIGREPEAAALGKILLSDQAILNLGLSAKPVKPSTFWRTLQVPAMVVDRPGISDRNITSPAAGLVAKIHHLPGSSVSPGQILFTVRLLSETLHQTQSELFRAGQDIKLAQAQRKRLEAAMGGIPESRLIEVDNQIARLDVSVKAATRELLNRGLTPPQVDEVAGGTFVNEIQIQVPKRVTAAESQPAPARATPQASVALLEVQELKVELGQQVTAGQTLCLLADHQSLAIEGRAFRDETPLLERAVKERWPVEADFQEDSGAGWGELGQELRIRHLANNIDPVNRTFAFLIPLENQFRVIRDGDKFQILWRFRPGQKLKLMVRVDRLDNVFVLPAEAVTREGSETYLFLQNVNTFERKAVVVARQAGGQVALANDGSLPSGSYVVQGGAAQLNRMVKASSSGPPRGYHIHADGSLHKNEDEGR